jgi:cytochrome c oxidase subunit 2
MPAALVPVTPQGGAVSGLIWSFSLLCAFIWLLVMVALARALVRRRRADAAEPLELLHPRVERRTTWIVGALIGLTGLIVVALTVLSYAAQHQLFAPNPNALQIHVVGHQWWWEIVYNDPDPSRIFTTANEIHVPTGRPVAIELSSADVIHSFWVPSLMGKADAIPGRADHLTFTAEKPGVYTGTCAEFCGLQHAHMGIRVVAQSGADFAAWRADQLQPAAAPATALARAGQGVFQRAGCALCHTIAGTPAGGAVGPDLTHLASRGTLAAGTLPFGRGQLAGWISDPQGLKPGAQMPNVPLSSGQLNAVVDYLMGLK